MNAIRKATEHKRKPPRPRVSEAGRRVLEFLDNRGWQLVNQYATKQSWHCPGCKSVGVYQITLVSLNRAGLIAWRSAGQAVEITDLGRSILRGGK